MTKKILLVMILLIGGIGYFWYTSTAGRISVPSFDNTSTLPFITKDENSPRLTTIVEGLEVPWAIVFLPDNSMLVTERAGRVRRVTSTGQLEEKPLLELSVVKEIQGEGGLHGITLHPDFEKNKYVYVYYTYENIGNESLNRVVRYTYENNTLTENKIIIDKIPGALFHDGGRIKFGPDNDLYITTGDAQNPSLAQDTKSLAGKILRVTDEGSVPSDNPFGTHIYSYGHRNPQGITWDDTGRLWSTEHGPSGSGVNSGRDELNLIKPGSNYGWPEITGDQIRNGMSSPVAQSGSETWAPGGAAFLEGSIYFVGLRGQALYKATIQGEEAIITEYLKGELGRIREVVLGPDNMLYITTSNKDGRGIPETGDDKIIRVNPAKL